MRAGTVKKGHLLPQHRLSGTLRGKCAFCSAGCLQETFLWQLSQEHLASMPAGVEHANSSGSRKFPSLMLTDLQLPCVLRLAQKEVFVKENLSAKLLTW